MAKRKGKKERGKAKKGKKVTGSVHKVVIQRMLGGLNQGTNGRKGNINKLKSQATQTEE